MTGIKSRAIPTAPLSFDARLQQLWDEHVLQVLPDVREVEHHHAALLAYCREADPLFIVRALTATVRGNVYRTDSGSRFTPSDNAPAWWMHALAFNGIRDVDYTTAPTHLFEIGRRVPSNINAAGWHVAHIYGAKDRDTNWQSWDRAQLTRRFIRNIHPCNCFYIPKNSWRRLGADPKVIGVVAQRYAGRYRSVWPEFVSFAGGHSLDPGDPEMRYECSPKSKSSAPTPNVGHDGIASYQASRLTFKADVIEPLADDAVFEVITPVGRFRLTKTEFYREFPGVVASVSYHQHRSYNYSKLPSRALRFKVDEVGDHDRSGAAIS
jgi:hypothetical protein